MRTFIRILWCSCLVWFVLAAAVNAEEVKTAGIATIRTVRIASVINPVVADFISQELEAANQRNDLAFLLEIDTPGGLDTAMRQIIQGMLGSRIPVIAYVYPAGARAASAGALIMLAADFAAMAPGTNLGAAHPVAIGPGGGGEGGGEDSTMMTKVVNDAVAYARSIAEQRGRDVDWAERIVRESISTPAREALGLKVVDVIADDETQLLQQLDGRTYLRGGERQVFSTSQAVLVHAEMGWRQEILNTISHPNIAYMLLMLGMLGIFFEISQPGVVLPGVLGAIALLLAFLGLQTLPVNYVGVLLILLALVMFILEVKVVSYGMLTVGGILSMALGSIILIDSSEPYLQISRGVIAATVMVSSGFFLFALYFVMRTQRTSAVSGMEGMIGMQGQALTDLAPRGQVFVHGEYWQALANEPIPAGTAVVVVAVRQQLVLEVRPVQHS